MKCYKNLLDINNLKNIYGVFILIPIILFHFVCLIIACVKGNNELKKQIKYLVEAKNKYILVKKDYLKYKKDVYTKKEFKKTNLEKDTNNNEQIEVKKEEKIENNNLIEKEDYFNIYYKKIKKRKSSEKSLVQIDDDKNLQEIKNKLVLDLNKSLTIKDSTKEINKINSKLFLMNTENIEQNHNFKLNNSIMKKLYSETLMKYKKIKTILKPNLNEINSFSFKKALKHDKRKYLEYYCSLIKTQHSIFFSFCPMNDYNIKIIKIDLFFIDIILNYTINALFFNDSTMHQIYEDLGEFNFIYQLPQIIYSSLITDLFSSIIKFTALTEDNVLNIKHSKKYENFKKKAKITYKIINIKFILFCLISSLMLLIFFYYDWCFCVVYKNTQIHLISDFIFSFFLSLFYPLIFYLIPGILRIPAINKKKEILYKISIIIQNI